MSQSKEIKSFPVSEVNDSAKNFFIGWVEQALRNGTLSIKNWNEGVETAIRFGKEWETFEKGMKQ
jgi:hypothetical protein